MGTESDTVRSEAVAACSAAKVVFWIAGTKASCTVAELLNNMTDQRMGDEVLLQFASATKLHGMPRSQDFLANYMNGTAEARIFDLGDLLLDEGARSIVVKHFHIRAHSLVSFARNVITIGQTAYKDPDWKNALGTYFIYYLDLGQRRNSFGLSTKHVLAWGEDTYQWHPDDTKRFTQCLHKAASRLETKTPQGVKAAPFKMMTGYSIVDTATGICTPAQSEPLTMTHQIMSTQLEEPRPMCRGE